MSDSWCLIESDPGVFTELCHAFGCTSVELTEMYSLDEAAFQSLSTPFGLVFLFKWRREADERATLSVDETPSDLFFAKQVINNACATQALLNVLMNVELPDFTLGETLDNFRGFTASFDPDLKGATIGNSDVIREVHNSFARAEPFVVEQQRAAQEDDDVFHFIAYVPFRGRVYELDGLKAGPVLLGEYDAGNHDSWTQVARPAIEQRIARYAASEVRFNLLAMVRNSVQLAEGKVSRAEARLADGALDDAQRAALLGELQDSRAQLEDARARYAQWERENKRRRHNYVPFTNALLQALAVKGKLAGMVEAAKPRWAEKAERLMKQRAAAKA